MVKSSKVYAKKEMRILMRALSLAVVFKWSLKKARNGFNKVPTLGLNKSQKDISHNDGLEAELTQISKDIFSSVPILIDCQSGKKNQRGLCKSSICWL